MSKMSKQNPFTRALQWLTTASLYQQASLSLLLKIVGTFSGFIFYLFISRQFGAQGMGVYTLFISILGLLGVFCCMGLTSATMRLVPEILASKQNGDLYYLRRIQFIVTGSLSCASSILLVFAADFLAIKLFHQAEARQIIYLIALILPIYSLYLIGNEYLRTLGEGSLFEYFRSTHIQLGGLILLTIVSIFYAHPYLAIFITLGLYMLAFLIVWFRVQKRLLKSHLKRLAVAKINLKSILKIALPMMLTAFSALLMERIDSLMLGYFHGNQAVGIYGIAFKLATLMMFLIIPLNSVLIPKMSHAYWQQQQQTFLSLVRSASRIMFWAGLGCLVFLGIFSEQLLSLFGAEFVAAKFALLCLICGYFFNAIHGIGEHLLNFSGNEKLLMRIFSLGLLINIVLNGLLIPKYGINGAAIASMLAMIIWNTLAGITIRNKIGIHIVYLPLLSPSTKLTKPDENQP